MKKKILIIGHGRHGKDTVAELLRDYYDFTFESSSMAAAKIFLYDALHDKYGYETFEDCYRDRHNRRAEWHDLICAYNAEDPARLAKDILEHADIYVGMRSDRECRACLEQGVFDLVIGVYDPRKPLEGPDSFNIDMWGVADVVIPNGSTLEDLARRVSALCPLLFSERLKIY